MSEPPRDPLAEHPLGSETPRKKGRATLELFPDLGEAPIDAQAAGRSKPGDLSAPSTLEDATPEELMSGSASASAGEADEAEDAEEIDEPGEPIPDLPEGESAEGVQAVAFARRLVAGLADLVILALVGAVELTAGAFALELSFPPAAFLPLAGFLTLAALVLLVLAPFVWGTTPGMALADLRIRARDGGSPTLAAAFLRFLGFALTLTAVPLLVAAFDRRGRTLADLLSGTLVTPAERARRA